MTGLVAFLRARLREEEAAALDTLEDAIIPYDEAIQRLYRGGWHSERASEHISRWHPQRVLADIESKRRLVDDFAPMAAKGSGAEQALSQWTLECLALPYADHPDYEEKWRP